jgi:hypothetical protein
VSVQRYAMLVQEEALALVCARPDGFEERAVRGVLELPEVGVSVALGELYEALV